ncbi:glycosyltransferase [Flavobacterium sp.]|uniref:glycosyltransferase n=1 Tax=Flavobacterium sp. TaxID=239 RepID=UPI00286E53FB|nr:glycosyltransferase [Flavobacterium sp.]
MQKKRILFLGETYRADAITWINGLKEFGDFEIVTWELKSKSNGLGRVARILELIKAFTTIRSIAKTSKVDMIIAERTTSYGFLAALSGVTPIAIAQQGITDLWPENSITYPFKKIIQRYAFKKATLIHAWGPVMAKHMKASKVDMSKVMILPKGINLSFFEFQNNSDESILNAIVTRTLQQEYKHEVILNAFGILKQKNIPFQLTIVGDGVLLENLKKQAIALQIENEVYFTGRVNNTDLPKLLQKSNFYISMPTTEGVSASLFEAMACGCFPIVTDLPGNRSWIKHKENGILVPSENYTKLASEMEWAFQNHNVRQKSIVTNRKFVEENANYEKNMKKIADAYHQLIATKHT